MASTVAADPAGALAAAHSAAEVEATAPMRAFRHAVRVPLPVGVRALGVVLVAVDIGVPINVRVTVGAVGEALHALGVKTLVAFAKYLCPVACGEALAVVRAGFTGAGAGIPLEGALAGRAEQAEQDDETWSGL